MSDNHIDEAEGRVKEAAGSCSDDPILKNDPQPDAAKTTVKDKGNNLVDTLPGRGSE